MPAPGLALRARLLCVLTASAAAACSPSKEGGPPTPPEAATTAPPPVKTGPPPSVAEGEPPRPTPKEEPPRLTPKEEPPTVATSGATSAAPPVTCERPTNRCFPPRSDMRGAMVRVDLSKLPFDANGCLPQDQVGGTCLGFRPTSGPKLRGGQCCYDGCASQPAPCGRPLSLVDGVRVAALLRGNDRITWT